MKDSRWSSVKLSPSLSDSSPLGLLSYKLLNVPTSLSLRWKSRLEQLDCHGVFVGHELSQTVTIHFWITAEVLESLSKIFSINDSYQLTLF